MPTAAYLHVPFCRHRCGYCNFSVVANRDDLIERFLRAIDLELTSLDRPSVETVFVGGGTPTHLSVGQIDRLLTLIRDRFTLDDSIEWSVEANPEDITSEKLDLLVRHGVNRISLGVQSFDDAVLHTLGRGHSGRAAMRAVSEAAERIHNTSIDLIFAAPEESLDVWRHDLQSALSLPIQHLSTYALTFEKGTNFWSRRRRGDLQPLGESLEIEMYEMAREMSAEAGLVHYEISNFARTGAQCRHNLSYWDGQGWYAAGPGAARFVRGRREVNHRSTSNYLRRIESGQDPTDQRESISTEQFGRERAAFGIRMIQGIDLDGLSAATGVALAQLCGDAIEQSIGEGLLCRDDGLLRLTERGVLFADTVASRLLG